MVLLSIEVTEDDLCFLRAMAMCSKKALVNPLDPNKEDLIPAKTEEIARDMLRNCISKATEGIKAFGVYRRPL